MTGVAATILQGETTHAAIYLNQQKRFSPEQIERWKKTKMVIIDEISFADKNDIVKIDKHLKSLKEKTNSHYGGLNIIFVETSVNLNLLVTARNLYMKIMLCNLKIG